ncbi:MAG: hypothetical protein L3K03_06320 [Thermoplasmata archaeon]|nr:hypothetical protein [Thermoplasmata archaeon]
MPSKPPVAPTPEAVAPSGSPGVQAAILPCEICQESTPHRILRMDPQSRRGARSGIARCRQCQTTHPFDVPVPTDVRVRTIISRGVHSEKKWTDVPRGRRLQLGTGLHGSEEGLVIQRLELPGGRSVSTARSDTVETVWLAAPRPSTIPISVHERGWTQSLRLRVEGHPPIEVGASLRVGAYWFRVVAVRARRQTWNHVGDVLPAEEVDRIYARPTTNPPPGNNRWSSEREMPNSRARSDSTPGRSRSSPGRTTARRVPRDRNDEGGAADQRDSPS